MTGASFRCEVDGAEILHSEHGGMRLVVDLRSSAEDLWVEMRLPTEEQPVDAHDVRPLTRLVGVPEEMLSGALNEHSELPLQLVERLREASGIPVEVEPREGRLEVVEAQETLMDRQQRHAASLAPAGHLESDAVPSSLASGVRVGERVRPVDRQNVGTVVAVAGEVATVHFVSPFGREATKVFNVSQLTSVDQRGAAEKERAPARNLSALYDSALGRLTRRARGEEQPIPMPWPRLEAQFGGGLWPGLHVLNGGTGVAKTGFVLQVSLHAVRHGVPVAYVGLELDELQLVARLVAPGLGIQWSDLYLGRATREQLEQLAVVREQYDLPLYAEQGAPGGWPYVWISALVKQLREEHPEGRDENGESIPGSRPLLVVVDFLQLVGDESAINPGVRPLDIRDRIGRAAYAARQVAREEGVAVLLVSSIARESLRKLSDIKKAGGLNARRIGADVRTYVNNPDVLIATGKESGEIEYAADSVSVLHRVASSKLVLATAKMRAGVPSWWAFNFDGSALTEATPDEVIALGAETKGSSRERSKADAATVGTQGDENDDPSLF